MTISETEYLAAEGLCVAILSFQTVTWMLHIYAYLTFGPWDMWAPLMVQ